MSHPQEWAPHFPAMHVLDFNGPASSLQRIFLEPPPSHSFSSPSQQPRGRAKIVNLGMAGKVREKVGHAANAVAWITTMPWVCLQAAIEQILQEQNPVVQSKQLDEWRARKNSELKTVSLTGTLIASAVTGSIQWSALGTAHWLVFAAWYSTLLFSLISVMMAFYLSILLSNFSIHNSGNSMLLKALHRSNCSEESRWASLFALQMPIMLLSYALMMYIVGLSLLVIRPLWSDPWGHTSFIAICYCVFLGLALLGTTAVCHFIYVKNKEVLKFD